MNATDATAPALNGLSIFVVEDEAFVAMMLDDILSEFGARVIGPAMNLANAESLAAECGELDAAVLDVNVGGQQVYPFARVLAERGVPIVFATGYGNEGLDPDWRSHTTIQKPYLADEVLHAIRAARSRS